MRARSKRGVVLSSWLAEAATARLRADPFLDAWEAGHGALTARELARAQAELGLRSGEQAA